MRLFVKGSRQVRREFFPYFQSLLLSGNFELLIDSKKILTLEYTLYLPANIYVSEYYGVLLSSGLLTMDFSSAGRS